MSPKTQESEEQDESKRENDRVLALERELQSTRLELEEAQMLLSSSRRDLELATEHAEAERARDLKKRLEKLFEELAGPVTQLLVQDYMLNGGGKPIKSEEIMAGVKRLIRVLQSHGCEIQGTIGATVAFDKNIHEALALEEIIDQGDVVVLRMPGISYDGRMLRRAAVTKRGAE